MTSRTRKFIAGGMFLAPAALASCEGYHPVITPIVAASDKYNLSDVGMVGLAACESALDPDANRGNGKSYKSLFQQGAQYWVGRVGAYNKRHPELRVSTDIYDETAQSNVSAEMIAMGGLVKNWECESKYHCYSNPNGANCKPDLWRGMLAQSGMIVIGTDIIAAPKL